jgi:hypothetical protein
MWARCDPLFKTVSAGFTQDISKDIKTSNEVVYSYGEEKGYSNTGAYLRTGTDFKLDKNNSLSLRAHLGKDGNIFNMAELEARHKISKVLAFRYHLHYHANTKEFFGELPPIGFELVYSP